jgi:microcystin-dependent protein
MKRWIAALLLCLPTLTFAAGSEQTLNTLPTNNASFLTTLQNFLKREDAQRFELQFAGFVVSGGTHSTAASLTAAPTALVAFPGGHYVTENNSITYANNETTWVIAHKDLTGNLSNFVRVSGTHYLIDSTSASKPSLPADSVWLMEVTTSGGSITAVTDLRTRVPETATYLFSELPAAGQRGRTAFVRDVGSGTLYLDNGTSWVQMVSSNPMTTVADMIVGGTGGIPARLPGGTANQVLGMNSGATAQEYKSVVAGSGIGVSHAANAITITQTVFPPTGSLQAYMGTVAPTGWLLCDGAEYDPDTYPDLFDIYVPNAGSWGRGTAVGTFTVNTTTNELTAAGHGLANGERVHVVSTTTLPAPLPANTKYFVISATTDTLQLSTTAGGSAVDLTTTGTGTHSLYDQFKVPDFRARMPVGSGANSYTVTISAVDTGTETITIDSNSSIYTGAAVFYDTTAGVIGGLTDATTYYAIRVSAATMKLATTVVNANNNTAINLTSAGSGVQTLSLALTTRTVGAVGGAETFAAATNHDHNFTDPGHAHTVQARNSGSGANNQILGNSSVASSGLTNMSPPVTVETTGITMNSGVLTESGNNMTPFLAVSYIVKY